MADVISIRKHEDLKDQLERTKNRLKNVKEEGAKMTRVVLRTAAAGGSAALIGYFEGRADKPEDTELLGMPVSLAVAAAGTIVNVGGYAGDEQTGELIQGVADGALAAYLYGIGKEAGVKSKTEAAAA